LVYSLAILNILHTAFWYTFGHLVIKWQFGIFSHRFGILCQEKSGNPDM
jgi:hypothetical protein